MKDRREAANPRSARLLLSVVVPCYNEEPVIAQTHERLIAVLGAITDSDFELIYVDDGSRDGTLDVLAAIQRTDTRVRVIALSRNFGHEIATTAGLTEATGDAVALIDADLQDPPEVLPEMLDRWRQGADVAYGKRIRRDGETAVKRLTSRIFYRLLNRLADVPIPHDTGDFRLMDRRVVDAFLAMPERDRFVRGMVAWVGFRQEPVLFHRNPRAAGKTSYTLRQLVHLATDSILSFSVLPLRLATWMGFLAALLALLGMLYGIVIRLLTDQWIPGWAALFVAILFMGGVQLVLIGVLGEYIGRIYGEVKQRPLYLVRERLGFPDVPRTGTGE